MKFEEKVVCRCALLDVSDIMDYMKDPKIAKQPIEERLKTIGIGQECGCCKYEECNKIDIHYSRLMKV